VLVVHHGDWVELAIYTFIDLGEKRAKFTKKTQRVKYIRPQAAHNPKINCAKI